MRRLLTYILLCMLPLTVAAETVKQLQQKQKELQQQIDNTNKMLQQTKKDETATINKLQLLNKNIQTQKKLITTLGNEIDAIDGEMTILSHKRDSLQSDLERYKEDYARMVRESHYQQLQQSPILFVLSAADFQQGVRRLRYMQEVAHYRRQQVARIESTQAEIAVQNDALQAHRDTKSQTLKEQKRQQENLNRDEKKQKNMLSQLKKKEKDLSAQLKKQEKKVAELNRKIDDIIRQQTKQTSSTLTKEQKLVAGGFEANKGRLPWPVEKGFISSGFGKQQHPVYENVITDNKGIYIQTEKGVSARAVYEGTVSSCFQVGGTYAVIVQHGNYRTVYSNLSRLSVKQGDAVKAKQAIGTIYSDPEQDNKTELYFQIYKDRTILNPSLWIAK